MKKTAKSRRTKDGRSTRKRQLSAAEVEAMIVHAEESLESVRREVMLMQHRGLKSVWCDGVGKIARGSQLIREFAVKLRVGVIGENG